MVFGRAKRFAMRLVRQQICNAPQFAPTAIQRRYRPAAGREPLVGVKAIEEIATKSREPRKRQREGSTHA